MAVLGKNIWGPVTSSFGRQPRLSEITIEAISGVLPKFTLETWRRAVSAERARIEAPRGVGLLGECRPPPPPQPTRGASCLNRDVIQSAACTQRGPGRSPGRQRILGIFQGLRILVRTNQKFGGPGQDLGDLCPLAPA